MSIIWRYMQLKEMSPKERKNIAPRVCIFGGKAASAYDAAKRCDRTVLTLTLHGTDRMIRLVTAVGEVINNDPDVGDLIKVYFLPDYNVTLAETLIPGTPSAGRTAL